MRKLLQFKKSRLSKRFLVYSSLLTILLLLIILQLTSSSKGDSQPSLSKKSPALSQEKKVTNPPEETLSLQPNKKPSMLKIDLLEKAISPANSDADLSGRNIFIANQRYSAENVAAIEPPDEEVEENTEPEVPIEPINLKFIGMMIQQDSRSHRNEIQHAILSDEEDIYIVKKGDVVKGQYKVLNIKEETVELKNMQNEKTETLKLES